MFDVGRARQLLQVSGLRFSLEYVPEVDSTNRLLRERALAGGSAGLVILTDYQSQGRGRRGRNWEAPRATSLLLSVLLDPVPGALPADYVILAAVSIRQAVEAETHLPVGLKWPNDVLIRGRKVSGTLVELLPDQRVILGVGINGNFLPGGAGQVASATSLWAELGHEIDRESLLIGLLNAVDVWYRKLIQEPDAPFAFWSRRLDTLGKAVTVVERDSSWNGVAAGVQRDGGLVVQTERGRTRVVYAADVSVRVSSHTNR